jgi:hypothetical protein
MWKSRLRPLTGSTHRDGKGKAAQTSGGVRTNSYFLLVNFDISSMVAVSE